MSTFWEKVRHYANRKVKRQYMDKFRHDRKCPNCKLWTSEVGGAYKIDYTDNDHVEVMTCRQCNYKSRWDCSSGFMTLSATQESYTPKGGDV